VTNGCQINDINFAQMILKENFQTQQANTTANKFKLNATMQLVQILHVHGNDWIIYSAQERFYLIHSRQSIPK